jgi:amidase
MIDELGAFRPDAITRVAGAPGGPLADMTFAVKDLFDVAGMTTGAGNPTFLAGRAPATRNASAVQKLLDAGATLVGKTITDELAFGLAGENAHYGTPRNSAAPGRIPGGSSSGSVAVVAGGVCDTALGTDTGGSVRVPSSHCGVFGLRTTHGRIPVDGLVPLAASFDTVGWFARTAETLARVGSVLLPDYRPQPTPTRLLVAADALEALMPEAVDSAADAIDGLARSFRTVESVRLSDDGLEAWRFNAFRFVQGYEAWQSHGDWIARAKPDFGPGVAERFAAAATITRDEYDAAMRLRATIAAKVRGLLDPQTVLCVPSAAGAAPFKGTSADDLEPFRNATLSICCIAGLAGLPQISLPRAMVDGAPLGISLIARPGGDEMLLRAARELR